MVPHYICDRVTLHAGDCLDVLRAIPGASVDAIVTDPPYGLAEHKPERIAAALAGWLAGDREQVPDGKGFMGRAWDGFVPPPAVWDECLRVLKPGGYVLAFAGSRTQDLMGLSIRLAGFELRDSIAWLYGSGFPKSLDVSKAITATERHGGANSVRIRKARLGEDYTPSGRAGNRDNLGTSDNHLGKDPTRHVVTELTENGARWQGWGTALKPGFEPVVVARKPLEGTVAANVLAHGTGALNIDACRIALGDERPPTGSGDMRNRATYAQDEWTRTQMQNGGNATPDAGRWPANVVLDEHAAAELDVQSGVLHSQNPATRMSKSKRVGATGFGTGASVEYADTGGASRFFPVFRYQAKAPARERPKVDGVSHPTVKPLDLMRWLVRLVAPPGGTVLDPFAGSGTTIEAALQEGFHVIGVEREPDYLPLIVQRIQRATTPAQTAHDTPDGLFDLPA